MKLSFNPNLSFCFFSIYLQASSCSSLRERIPSLRRFSSCSDRFLPNLDLPLIMISMRLEWRGRLPDPIREFQLQPLCRCGETGNVHTINNSKTTLDNFRVRIKIGVGKPTVCNQPEVCPRGVNVISVGWSNLKRASENE